MSARLRNPEFAMPATITAVFAVATACRLGHPAVRVFDEIYYVRDALVFLHGGEEITLTHPPLGKWLVAAGIAVAGDGPVGWRLGAWLFGTTGVLLTYLLTRRLLGSLRWAAVTAALTAVSGLWVVHSRVAMLEISLGTFLVGAAFGFVVHQARVDDRSSDGSLDLPLLLAGLSAGGALSVKWSAAPAVVLLALATVAVAPSRRTGPRAAAIAFVAIPAAVYVAAYSRTWINDGFAMKSWIDVHVDMLRAERDLRGGHSGTSPPLTWPLMTHPVDYHLATSGSRVEEVVAVGNPALWWGFLVAIPALLVTWWRRRDRTVELVLGAWVALFLPWVIVARPTFVYYLTPLAPFTALGVAWALQALAARGRLGRDLAIAAVALILVTGAWYWPLWTSLPIPPSLAPPH